MPHRNKSQVVFAVPFLCKDRNRYPEQTHPKCFSCSASTFSGNHNISIPAKPKTQARRQATAHKDMQEGNQTYQFFPRLPPVSVPQKVAVSAHSAPSARNNQAFSVQAPVLCRSAQKAPVPALSPFAPAGSAVSARKAVSPPQATPDTAILPHSVSPEDSSRLPESESQERQTGSFPRLSEKFSPFLCTSRF